MTRATRSAAAFASSSGPRLPSGCLTASAGSISSFAPVIAAYGRTVATQRSAAEVITRPEP